MKVLAIDQSFTSCGIVVTNDDDLLYCERYCSDPDLDVFKRAWEIAQHISKLAHQHLPQIVAVEGLAFNKFGNATRDLAGLQFVIVTQLRYLNNFPVVVVSPNSVKKIATGKGNSNKQQMVDILPDSVKKKFDALKVRKSTGLYDLTDAYWIAIAANKNVC